MILLSPALRESLEEFVDARSRLMAMLEDLDPREHEDDPWNNTAVEIAFDHGPNTDAITSLRRLIAACCIWNPDWKFRSDTIANRIYIDLDNGAVPPDEIPVAEIIAVCTAGADELSESDREEGTIPRSHYSTFDEVYSQWHSNIESAISEIDSCPFTPPPTPNTPPPYIYKLSALLHQLLPWDEYRLAGEQEPRARKFAIRLSTFLGGQLGSLINDLVGTVSDVSNYRPSPLQDWLLAEYESLFESVTNAELTCEDEGYVHGDESEELRRLLNACIEGLKQLLASVVRDTSTAPVDIPPIPGDGLPSPDPSGTAAESPQQVEVPTENVPPLTSLPPDESAEASNTGEVDNPESESRNQLSPGDSNGSTVEQGDQIGEIDAVRVTIVARTRCGGINEPTEFTLEQHGANGWKQRDLNSFTRTGPSLLAYWLLLSDPENKSGCVDKNEFITKVFGRGGDTYEKFKGLARSYKKLGIKLDNETMGFRLSNLEFSDAEADRERISRELDSKLANQNRTDNA